MGLRRRGERRRGRDPQLAVWRGATVLRWRWPPSRAGAQLPVDCVSLLGGWLVLLRGCDACRVVGGGLQRPPS